MGAERDSLATQNASLAKAFSSTVSRQADAADEAAQRAAGGAGAAAGGGGAPGPSQAQLREIASLMQRLTKENAVLIKAR